jgi:hypothetical protein
MISSPIFDELFENYNNVEELMNLLALLDFKSENNQITIIKSQYMQVV